LDDQNNKGGFGKLYSVHGRDEKYIQWLSKKPVREKCGNEPLGSIQGGELLEYINDITYGLPSLELFICLFVYIVCRVNMLSDGSS